MVWPLDRVGGSSLCEGVEASAVDVGCEFGTVRL